MSSMIPNNGECRSVGLLELVACITDMTQIPVVMSWFTGIVVNHRVELSSDMYIGTLYSFRYFICVYTYTIRYFSCVYSQKKSTV